MRIALIDPSLFTWPYDAALALALREAGHEVTIFGRSMDGGSDDSAADLLYRHFYRSLDWPWIRKLPHAVFMAIKGISHIVSMFTLLGALRAKRPDIIHFQWAPLPIIDRWFLPALRGVAPVVLTVHDSAPFNNNPRSILQRWGAIGIMSRFDHLIVHTRAAAQRVESYGVNRQRISVMPHGPLGGDFPVLSAVEKPPSASEKGPVKLLLFGKIKPYKGLDVLLRAVAAMPRDLARRCEVWVVGAPYMDMQPLRDFVEQSGLGDIVNFDLRFVADEEIPDILARADVMVMPYREIDASGVLMMALSAGLPIVASRIGLFAELLEDGKHGRLIGVEDAQSLAAALSELVSDGALRTRMRMEVRALRAELPGWKEIGRRTVSLYLNIVESNRMKPLSRWEVE